MAYQSAHSGPEIDAAAALVGDLQAIRDESNANRNTVVALAAQVATDADRTVAAAYAIDGVVQDAEAARDAAQGHANTADIARAAAVAARNEAQAAQAGVAQDAADALAAADIAQTHATGSAQSEEAASVAATEAMDSNAQAQAAKAAAESAAASAATDAGRAETAAASVDGVVAAAVSARDAAQGYRNEAETFRDQAAQSAADAASVVLGNVFDDNSVRADRGWTSEKIEAELAELASQAPVDNLTTSDATKPLSANQGRVLKGFVDAINDILQSDDGSLDELQEIVDFVKINRAELDALGIDSIAGLRAALNGKQAASQVLSDTTAAFTTAQRDKLANIQAGAQVNSVTSVAGKTGAVSLTSGDVGLGRVNNITDTVSTAQPSGGVDGDAWDVVS